MITRRPPFRKLRGYAFDPALSLEVDTAEINSMVYKVPWEDLNSKTDAEIEKKKDPSYRPQGPGPVGEYVEVIDYDPTVEKYYEPVDLNDPYLLAQDGFAPSESNPLFHQQMVYAVVMTTIKNFEKALGRKIIWAPRRVPDPLVYQVYVPRLRIYPHAFRDANAYYSPQKKALLFGYFSSTPANISLQMPGSLIFTCLSHDIIAHETTHAILDGLHRQYNNPTNPDVLAFHEAFADIVALFQHFTFPDVLKKQIAETRGDLGSQNLLGKLAQQFGTAIGSYGSLRDAIGEINKDTQEWKPKKPNADDYRVVLEPHTRGSILVAAVFEAFIFIYKTRAADLLRIASNGTGILAQGELHPDLVNRLAGEAAKAAQHVLNMCIRALDYCPPVDITFGDYLRAIITADLDIMADDPRGYRLMFINAFRRRGIYPTGIKTLSVDSLRYSIEPIVTLQTQKLFNIIVKFLKEYRAAVMYETDRHKIYNISTDYMGGNDKKHILGLHHRITMKFEGSSEFEKLTGLVFNREWKDLGIKTSKIYQNADVPSIQVANLRLVSRVGPNNDKVNQIVFSLVQRSGIVVEDSQFKEHYTPDQVPPGVDTFELWGGCSLIFDLDTLKLKYAIARPLLDSQPGPDGKPQIDRTRIENQYNYQHNEDLAGSNEFSSYFGIRLDSSLNEPFALLHQH